MENALFRRSIPEIRDGDIALPIHLCREPSSSGDWNRRTNDRDSSPKPVLQINEVHRATHPSRGSRVLAKNFSHQRAKRAPERQVVRVRSMSSKDPISGSKRFGDTHCYRFLPYREMTRAANLAGGHHLTDMILGG